MAYYKTKVSDPEKKYKNGHCILNILIVDDDDSARESLREMIEIRGHKVTTLDEGMKCVNRCYNTYFDIIFMDYHINDLDGKINGIDITKMVRECFDTDSIVYAYTGDNTTKAINNFKKNNIKGAFIKPVEPSLINEFLSIVEQNIDNTLLLSRLSIKKKNFMYFNKKHNKQVISQDI